MRAVHMIVFFIFFILGGILVFTSPAHASGGTDAFSAASTRYRIPKPLLLAIAQQESSLKPWVVNIAGKDFHPRSREEALRLIHAARSRKLSHDIGIMQINNWWLDRLRISPETALDPPNNVMLGAWILAQEIQRHGYNWKAVGAYHSPNRSRQVAYAHAVHKHYMKKDR